MDTKGLYIVQIIKETLARATGLKDPEVMEPKDLKFGDYSTNVAMKLSRDALNKANEIKSKLKLPSEIIEKIEIVPPGFINFFINKKYLQKMLYEIDEDFGKVNLGNGRRVLVEFVSANPTGPLNVANGRAAALGDSIVRIMNFCGYHADSEYYVNDSGERIRLLGESIKARMKELLGEKVEFPKDGYKGEYIKSIARDFLNQGIKNDFARRGAEQIVNLQKKTLERFGVKFTNWVHESTLVKEGFAKKVLNELSNRGYVYEEDGAKSVSYTHLTLPTKA